MTRRIDRLLALLGAVGIGASGCANFNQDSHQVLVRDPLKRKYEDPVNAGTHAKDQWQYAAMSDYAYEVAREQAGAKSKESDAVVDSDRPMACGSLDRPPIPSYWVRWEDFPSAELTKDMRDKGLFLLVLEKQSKPREIVVIFEGTNFTELPDWTANLRWFLRFVPKFQDHYTLTAQRVSEEFYARIKSRPSEYKLDPNVDMLFHVNGEAIRIVSTGHSLGGGLAQHFAYTFKQEPRTGKGPRVSEVFAFDPSPVTGWSTADDPPRTHNAHGLRINRVFEHGEILAYVRLFTSRLALSSEHPAIWEYRYNFDPKANIIRNHSMRSLACGLYRAAHEAAN